MPYRCLKADVAAGTTHTNSTDEAVLASYTFPAGFWQAGKTVHAHCLLVIADNNSTDTLTVKVRLGPTTLTGTAIATSSAVDSADADVCVVDIWLTCRDADSSGTIITSVTMNDPDAGGQAVEGYGVAVASLDLTAAQRLEVTGDWSVAHADNQVASQQWIVTEITPDL